MPTRSKPVLFVSRCLTGAKCRYDGAMIECGFLLGLAGKATIISACPEMELGLGVPRDPIRIVSKKGRLRLVQPATGRDLTAGMMKKCRQIIDSLGSIDGFVLKSRSPSCALRDAMVFSSSAGDKTVGRAAGFFGRAVMEKFSNLPVEDEKKLKDARRRKIFLARLKTAIKGERTGR